MSQLTFWCAWEKFKHVCAVHTARSQCALPSAHCSPRQEKKLREGKVRTTPEGFPTEGPTKNLLTCVTTTNVKQWTSVN